MAKQILNNKCIILLILFCLFTPDYLVRFETINGLQNGIKLISYIFIFLIYVSGIRKHIRKTFNITFLILWAELLLSTILSDETLLYNYLTNMALTVSMCFFIELLAMYSPLNGLHCLYWYFSACVLINTATIFLYPNAMYENNRGVWVCWFLGEDNSGYIFYIMASMLAMVHTLYVSRRLTLLSCLVWISSFIFVFHNDIATGIVCQILWLILILGYQVGWFRKLLKARYVLYMIVGGFMTVVLSRRFIFEPITAALGRSTTLTGRTLLWDRTLKRIQERPLLGFGIYSSDGFNNTMNTTVHSAHNWLLMLMFYGGITAVILFIFVVVCSCRDAKAHRNTPFYRCVVIGMIVMAVRFLVEAGHMEFMYLILTMLSYSGEFTQGLEEVKRRKHFVVKGIPRICLSRREVI